MVADRLQQENTEIEVPATKGIKHSCFGGQLNQFDGDNRSDRDPVSQRSKLGAEPNQTGAASLSQKRPNNELLNPRLEQPICNWSLDPNPQRNENRRQTNPGHEQKLTTDDKRRCSPTHSPDEVRKEIETQTATGAGPSLIGTTWAATKGPKKFGDPNSCDC
jgi:hypothetical protein